jgi:hypothetical protein
MTGQTIDTGTDELRCEIEEPGRNHHAEPAGGAQRAVGSADAGTPPHDQAVRR